MAINYRGEFTDTTDGLALALQILTNPTYGSRPDVPKIIILLTDGVPNVNVAGLEPVVAQIKADMIRLVTIGVTDQV